MILLGLIKRENKTIIEKEFSRIKVKDVQFRNQKIRVLKKRKDGIETLLGYDVKTDKEVEITRMPHNFNDSQRTEIFLNSFAAHKELTFSPFFLKYLGYNSKSDPNANLFFNEYIPLKSLYSLLKTSHTNLKYGTKLFGFWFRNILLALKNLHIQTRYSCLLPLTLKHFFVTETGIKLIQKNLYEGSKIFRNKIKC